LSEVNCEQSRHVTGWKVEKWQLVVGQSVL